MEIVSYVKINGEVSQRIPLGIEVNDKAELIALKAKLESEWEKDTENEFTEDGLKKYTIAFETRRKPNEKHLFGLKI